MVASLLANEKVRMTSFVNSLRDALGRETDDGVEVFTARRYSELIEKKWKFKRNFFIILRV